MTLNECKIGDKCVIEKLECGDDIKRRFLDMGLVPNTTIVPVFVAPFGDPVAYRVRGTTIAIRKEDSKQIYVNK